MLHQEIKTYQLSDKSNFSPHFSLKKLEDLYGMLDGKRNTVPHRHNYYKDGVGGTDFPVLINAYKNKARIDVSYEGLVVRSLNDQNKAEFEVKLK